MPIIIPLPLFHLCSVCQKRPATKQCDFPIGKTHYIGHPPLYQMREAQKMSVAWKKVEMNKTITCDKPLCDKCAIQMGGDIDFCPHHIQEILSKKQR